MKWEKGKRERDEEKEGECKWVVRQRGTYNVEREREWERHQMSVRVKESERKIVWEEWVWEELWLWVKHKRQFEWIGALKRTKIFNFFSFSSWTWFNLKFDLWNCEKSFSSEFSLNFSIISLRRSHVLVPNTKLPVRDSSRL